MSLDRITKKKHLEYQVPQIVTSGPEPDSTQYTVVDATSQVVNLVESYKEEIDNWQDLAQSSLLVSTNRFRTPQQFVEEFGPSITTISLMDWYNTGNTVWPEMFTAFEEQVWHSSSNALSLLHGVILEVKSELDSSLNTLQGVLYTQSGTGSLWHDSITEMHQDKVSQARTLRQQINQAVQHGLERLSECYLNKFAGLLQEHHDNTTSLNSADIQNSVNTLLNLVKTIKAIVAYQKIKSHVDWKTTRRNLWNRFKQVATEKLLTQAVAELAPFEKAIQSNLTPLISTILNEVNKETCSAFSELFSLIYKESYEIRFDLASKIINLKKYNESKYQSRLGLIALVEKRTMLEQHLSTLEIVLEALNQTFSSGRLDTQLQNYIKKQLVKKKSIPVRVDTPYQNNQTSVA